MGDGLPTDIRGAAENGFDAYFVAGGIHACDLGDMNIAANVSKTANKIRDQYVGINLAGICDRLRWT